MLDDIYFMKQALIEAGKAAERGEVPVGAVVVCKERIIARAHNLTEIVACFFILSYFIIQHPALIQALQIFIAVQLFGMLFNNGK